MTTAELLSQLEGIRARGAGKWSARCPAHADKSPSLTIAEGEKALLLKCWAGCSLEEITGSLSLAVKDLFFDALPHPDQRRATMQHRAQRKAARLAAQEAAGRCLDALREADSLIQSARGISIAGWSDDQLDAALDRLAVAYALLESEGSNE